MCSSDLNSKTFYGADDIHVADDRQKKEIVAGKDVIGTIVPMIDPLMLMSLSIMIGEKQFQEATWLMWNWDACVLIDKIFSWLIKLKERFKGRN